MSSMIANLYMRVMVMLLRYTCVVKCSRYVHALLMTTTKVDALFADLGPGMNQHQHMSEGSNLGQITIIEGQEAKIPSR